VKGGHSAALVESQWDEIANFIVNGEIPVVPESETDTELDTDSDFDNKRVPWVKQLHAYSPYILIVALLLLLLGLWFFVLPLIASIMALLADYPIRSFVTFMFVAFYVVISRL